MLPIRLVFPTLDMEEQVLRFKQKFYNSGERVINGSYKLDQDRYTFAEWLDILKTNLKPETANPKFGTSETFFAVNEAEELVGILNIRYQLTPFYQNSGHIGFSIVPDKRRNGYATMMLKLALERAKEHGLQEVKLVCEEKNAPSRKVIVKCGGQLHRRFVLNNSTKEEYIVTL